MTDNLPAEELDATKPLIISVPDVDIPRAELSAAREEIAQLREGKEYFRLEAESYRHQAESFAADNWTRAEELAALRADLATRARRYEYARTEVIRLGDLLSDAQADLAKRDEVIARMDREVADHISDLVDTRADLAKMTAEKAAMKAFLLDKTPAEFPGMLEVGKKLLSLEADLAKYRAALIKIAQGEVSGFELQQIAIRTLAALEERE